MTSSWQIPKFLRDLMRTPPRAGEGVHKWLFSMARQLHPHMPAPEIILILENCVTSCGRHVPQSEIVEAVQNSLRCAWQPAETGNALSNRISKWPAIDQKRLEEIVRTGDGLPGLWECSPLRIEDNEQHTEEIVDNLFPGNPLLCCGLTQMKFDTTARELWRGKLAQLQFISPNEMIAEWGTTKSGRQSKHSLSNTGARKYQIVECDFSIYTRDGKTETELAPLVRRLNRDGFDVLDMGAAVLIHLARYAPLVCVVHSGGKSLHGWFFVHGQCEDVIFKFFRYAVSLGGDPATWSCSQFVRMPDGLRDNGKRQATYFLNFKPLELSR